MPVTSGRVFVAGVLWPRTSDHPFLAVGLGPGDPGCTHDGIGPDWTVWPVPDQINRVQNPHGSDAIHGLAVDDSGTVYIAQGNKIMKLVTN